WAFMCASNKTFRPRHADQPAPSVHDEEVTALRVVRISVLSGPIGRRRSLPALSRQPYTGLLSRRKTQVLAQSREHALRFGDAADAVADSQGPAVAQHGLDGVAHLGLRTLAARPEDLRLQARNGLAQCVAPMHGDAVETSDRIDAVRRDDHLQTVTDQVDPMSRSANRANIAPTKLMIPTETKRVARGRALYLGDEKQ